MRALVVAITAFASACSLVIDTDELVVRMEVDIGSSADTHRLYPSAFIEGRGAAPGSPPNLALLRNAGVREGDRLVFDPDGFGIDCQPPGTESCNAAGDDNTCCIGPFVGSDPDLAAVLVRIGVQLDQPGEQIGPDTVDFELIRDGEGVARSETFPLVLLPELTPAAGAYTLEELNNYRPNGDEALSLFSRITIDSTIEVVSGGSIEGPARFVASNRITLGPNANLLSRVSSGADDASTSPVLVGTDFGGLGFFADELSIAADPPDSELPHFNADAVVFRGTVVGDRPDFTRCANFSPDYPPLPEDPNLICDFARVIRFDTGIICMQNDPDGDLRDVDACADGLATIELADSMRGMIVGPRLRPASGGLIVTGDTVADFQLYLEGAGTYAWSNDNDDGGQAVDSLTVDAVPVRLGFQEPRPDAGNFVSVAILDELELAPGKNVVCARIADGTNQAIVASKPEMGTCMEIIYLP